VGGRAPLAVMERHMPERLTRRDLAGKTIDIHAHAGVSLETYGRGEYPYASTVEGLASMQRAGGVDVTAVFPFTSHLYFDFEGVVAGTLRPAERPVSPAPYVSENTLLLREVYDYCPELTRRFLPFVSIDTERAVPRQLEALAALWETHPFYGIKVNPVLSQSHARALLDAGAPFLDFCAARHLPLLFHANPVADEYSHPDDIFAVVEARPDLRVCFAHCLLFHREYLDRAAAAPNAWVDTAALKIQVEMVHRLTGTLIRRADLIAPDLTDYREVFAYLAETYPETMLWGSDAPAYAYICRRQNAVGVWMEFRLKGTYEDEVAALRSLPPAVQARVAGKNTLDFLFGR